jgi:predicted RNase H-like nuclease (RuvC/YqgF family)
MDWTTLIAAAVTGLLTGGLGIAIVNGLFGRGTAKADAEMTTVTAAMKLVESLQGRVDKLTLRLDCLEREQERKDLTIDELTAENKSLKKKVDELELDKAKQLEVNRKQGDKIRKLTQRIFELEQKLDCNAGTEK